MIKIGPKPKRPIVVCELVEVSKKIIAVRPAEHAIVGIAVKRNKTWKLTFNRILFFILWHLDCAVSALSHAGDVL